MKFKSLSDFVLNARESQMQAIYRKAIDKSNQKQSNIINKAKLMKKATE